MFALIAEAIQGQRGHLFPWVPVCLATGIGGYFLLPRELLAPEMLGLGVCAVVLALSAAWVREGLSPLAIGLCFVFLGVLLGVFRAHSVAEPKLGWRYYGAIEGVIVGIDRSGSDKVRLTLAEVVLDRLPPERTPHLVRVSFHGTQGYVTPVPGLRVVLTGHLSPPSGPTEPGGFDFQRHAWFQKIGGVGYTRTPVLALQYPQGGQGTFGLRMAMSAHIQSFLPGDIGGFAAAVSAGDRSGMSKEAIEALRGSNLAHLLAISGLHLGLLAGFVFAVVRLGLALVPAVALRVPVKKLAAVAALMASAGYLSLSGGNVATQRAFIMAAVALTAVMLDRRAFSLRAVALAATIVMVMRPEAILGPGFQMSFAATTALVAVFGALRNYEGIRLPRWLRPVSAVVISSLVAGLATAPIAAAHFNIVSHYGLPANLLSVPVMGTVVVPAAVLAMCLAPLGLEWIGLWAMGLGLEWILTVAHFFADRPDARGHVIAPPTPVLPLFSMGMLILILWQGRLRAAGLVLAVAAIALWVRAERPEILIADSGGLIGVMTDDGRALSKPRGSGFIALNWLENDGDPVDQPQAATRFPNGEDAVVSLALGEGQLKHVKGKKASLAFSDCTARDIVVFTHDAPDDLPCRVLTPESLRNTGSIAFSQKGGVLKMTTAREVSGLRLWNR
ncbi:ComEC/Rec2 family competence protein [uncultured Shimia sp.]|uniref:ComEC/Rec2 family competence protein n=1 Tax=uncultured Shimia sp. TaxID=573152 RepID=UPI0026386751|nr:ComEC/Rec2 family competence protein [uncultured Shimia sp.]